MCGVDYFALMVLGFWLYLVSQEIAGIFFDYWRKELFAFGLALILASAIATFLTKIGG